jgi:fructokinase
MTFTAVVIGESLTDIVVSGEGQREHPGGSPMNVAIGLARLGADVQLHTVFGEDARGAAIAQHLSSNGVAVTPSSVSTDPTWTATATIDASGAATYEFDLTAALAPLPVIPSADVIHSGSIGAVVQPGGDAVLSAFERARATSTVSYDPNVRASVMGSAETAAQWISRLVAASDVVKASDEDLEWLSGGDDVLATAHAWSQTGPAVVVVTRGGLGADAFAGDLHVHVDAPTVSVVDTIGAGDSFMAGLITALGDRGLLGAANRPALAAIDAANLTEVISFAATCAAITVTRPGADPPRRADLVTA